MNLYQTLEINKDATLEEIKKAYRRLARQYHPDLNPGDDTTTSKFKEVQEAYEILSDSKRRAEYDRFGTIKQNSKPRHNPGANVWEEFFGGTSDKGRSIQVRVDIALEEVFTGVTKIIKVQQRDRCNTCEGKGYTEWVPCAKCSGSGRAFLKQSPFNIFVTCTKCRGTGRAGTNKCPDCLGTSFKPTGEKTINITIPPGIESGMQIRVIGEGEPGKNGARNGDILVVVIVKDHAVFKREGANLLLEVPLSYTQFVFGTELSIPNLNGDKIQIKIPKGTQSGTRFRIKNVGLPNMRNNLFGDLIVTTNLEVPESFNDEYNKVLQSLVKYEEDHLTPKRKAFATFVSNFKREKP